MKILILDAYFEPENTSFTHLENDLIEAFIAAGHELFIVCPTPTRGIDKETAKKYSAIKHEELYDGRVHVRRFWAPQEGRNTFKRAFRYFWCNYQLYRTARKIKDIDLIFSNSTPPIQGLVARRLKNKLKKPFVYNLQDIFPDSLVNIGKTKEGSLIWKTGRKIENKTYAAADKIIVISEDLKKNIMSKGVPADKIEVIYNWVDTDNVYKVERKENILFERYSLDRSLFYIAYSGNLGQTQNLDLLLNVAKKMRSEMPDLRFILIGDGSDRQRVEERVETEKIDNVIMLPYQDYKDISHVFSIGDVGLIISKKGVGNNSVPSKTYGYMAAERPILASFDKESQLANLIESVGCGVVAEADNEEALVTAIKEIRTDNVKGKLGRQYLLDNLSKEKCVTRYIDVFVDLSNKN